MTDPAKFNNVVLEQDLTGEDERETEELHVMCKEAEEYLLSFGWCPPIKRRYFGGGVGGVVAVFLFEFSQHVDGQDNWLWVVVGDVPSTYLVTNGLDNPRDVLEEYCNLMREWADAVLEGSPLENVYPVSASATARNAKSLLSRIKFIRERIIPEMKVL